MKDFIFIFLFIFWGNVIHSHPGIGLVYDGKKTIFYTDLDHVWKLDTETGLNEVAVENVHTHELYLDAEGNLFGEHYWYVEAQKQFKNYIWKLDRNGKLSKIRETQNGENTDFGFVRDREFAEHAIRKSDLNFEFIKQDSLETMILGTAALRNQGWTYLSKNGTFYFVDYPDLLALNNNKLYTIAEDLSSSRFPFSIQNDDHHLYGIWTDHLNNVYVAVYGGRLVKKIDQNSKVTDVLKTDFFWSPINGVFDKEQNLWLLESTINGRIRVRKVDGHTLQGNTSFFLENLLLVLLGVVVMLAVLWLIRKRN